MKLLKYKNIFILLPILVLSGCQQTDLDELKKEIQHKKDTAIPIEPQVPILDNDEVYVYSSIGSKSPFRNTITEIKTSKKTLTEIKPDLERVKSELENYNLENFAMMGTIITANEDNLSAILKISSGKIFIVKNGDYLGKNNGVIKNITTNKIELIEIIPNGSYRWVERPATIIMNQ